MKRFAPILLLVAGCASQPQTPCLDLHCLKAEAKRQAEHQRINALCAQSFAKYSRTMRVEAYIKDGNQLIRCTNY